MIYSDQLVVIADDRIATAAVLNSRVHEIWARFFSSSLKDDLRYAPSDCFETFPFPESLKLLDEAGGQYIATRAGCMKTKGIGLTAFYNRFHSPNERDPGILELRRLHSEMDVAVLRAYGWDDLADQATQPDFCQFLLDYEEDEDEEGGSSQSSGGSGRQKKKPWRYRWPDDFRDEVLARLLELNEQRHREEQLAGAKPNSAADGKREKAKSLTKRVTKAKETDSTQTNLF